MNKSFVFVWEGGGMSIISEWHSYKSYDTHTSLSLQSNFTKGHRSWWRTSGPVLVGQVLASLTTLTSWLFSPITVFHKCLTTSVLQNTARNCKPHLRPIMSSITATRKRWKSDPALLMLLMWVTFFDMPFLVIHSMYCAHQWFIFNFIYIFLTFRSW